MTQGKSFSEKMTDYRHQVENISNTILAQMQQTNQRWEMPWNKGLPMAVNAFNGKQYGGNNLLILWNKCLNQNYAENKWATIYQWAKVKAKVKRGEKGTLICFAIPIKRKHTIEKQLNLFEPLRLNELRNDNPRFKFRFRYVFNASQVKGYTRDMPDIFNPQRSASEIIQQLVEKSNAKIIVGGTEAFYRITTDEIQLPHIARFENTQYASQLDNYHATLIHELIHWTGHSTRCKRQILNNAGSPEYAFEELVAELGAALLCTQVKQKTVPPLDHANYLNSWIKVLKNDFSYFTEALELARTAIYFLNKLTDIYPFLKPKYEREINEKNVEKWKEILAFED